MDRRSFVMSGVAMAAAARGTAARANDRLRIGIAGPGTQGQGLMRQFQRVAAECNAELVAVCDLWSKRRDDAAAQVKAATGREPRKLAHYEELLAMKDLDGVIVATPDHGHSRQLIQAIRAGKDVFLEKPMGNVLSELKEAYRVARASKQVVQIGTQGLSTGSYQAVAAFVRGGKLGKISRVVHEGTFNGPRWRPVKAVSEIREQDTDWKAWLMGRKPRPFDPHLYFEFRVYREFSLGIPDQWLTHAIAAVHHIMDDYFPVSVVAQGGVLVHKDGRENSDTFQAVFTYPKGFLYGYSAQFGNDYPGFSRYYGENGTIERAGEGGGWVARPTGGGSRPEKLAQETKIEPVAPVPHVKNWLDCMRSRATPRADIHAGFAGSVAAIMAAQAELSGKRLYWDRRKEVITDRPPVT